jgi:hypothetical protein
MRLITLCLGMLLVVAVGAQPIPALRLQLGQVYLEGDRLDFDLMVESATDERLNLAFADVVLRFDASAVSDTARIFLWPQSSQLMSAEQQALTAYELAYNLRIDRKADEVLFYVGIDPPKFKNMSEFISEIAQMHPHKGLYRIGRFSITGLLQVPDVLDFHRANKGFRTQAYSFDPNNRFQADSVQLVSNPLNLMNQELEFFEIEQINGEVHLKWRSGELSKWKRLSVERTYDLNKWEELAFTPATVREIRDQPNPPQPIEGRPLVFYRLLITPNKGKAFYSPIRMVVF